jgi:hypothetical protein
MQEKEKIVISLYDSHGPEIDNSNVASFSFDDPQNPDLTYCIGYRFLGGELSDSKNWVYDHASVWTKDRDTQIDKQKVEDIISQYGTSLDLLLNDYCQKLQK